MKKYLPLIALLFATITFSCKTSKNTSTSPELAQAEKMKKERRKKVRGNSLIGELRRLPGVRVSGNDSNGTVTISQGANTIAASQGAFFVVNDVRMGNSFSRVVSTVDVQQIDEIKVLRGNEASSKYGIQGANGVIEIIMKK